MARKSGGFFSKLVLLGVGAAIGAAMTQKKSETGSTQNTGSSSMNTADMKENIKKNLDRFNEQSGGMVDKVKPHINKAVDTVKTTIEKQQQMMDKEKDALDQANKTVQDEVGETKGPDSSSGKTASSANKDSFSSTGSSSESDKPSGGAFGGSTSYGESLKKNPETDSSSGNSSNDGTTRK
ncbi:hypothetical protein [Planococcus sp. SSTMD024]|uniref:hypothetical protein n=1 Tax=Planococcus sp. SSTMD024 TaxID=3242163 RepID=UPI00351E0C37